ncbi:MAG: hypothetical protein FJZ58_03815 [Chlamydiae bacterium]|nr:hypothetical protein [Chlamydiota bacterium]
MLPHIGLDILGSDKDSNDLLESALPWIESKRDEAHFSIFCETKNVPLLQQFPFISYQIATEAISMQDSPWMAVRKKKSSSMLLGLSAMKMKQVDALVSLGNTGALTLAAKIHLGMLPGIKRPALLATIPSKQGNIVVLDVGANTGWRSSNLLEFAIMGLAYQKTQGIAHPKVALLNVGTESFKGTLEIKEAYQKMTSHPGLSPFFCGNIEGRTIFEGKAHVVVTDGFTGNIFLKTAEGVTHFLLDAYKKYFSSDPMHLVKLKGQLEESECSGAILAGVDGLVIKCHGFAHPNVFSHNLSHALDLVQKKFLANFTQEIASFFSSKSPYSPS